MTMLLHFWLRVLICCLGLSGVAWLIGVIRKSRQEEGLTTPIISVRIQLIQRTQAITSNMGKIILGVIIGLVVGYGIREHQLISNQQTYTAVKIVTKKADREFVVWPDRMKKQDATICPESSVDWREGQVLSDWTFEQRSGCKRVISYHYDKGELYVQMR